MSAGETVGKLEARICENEDDLNDWIDFRKLSEGFAPYAAQMASADVWPIAVLVDLEIYPAFQRRGFGRATLRKFLLDARAEGAKSALLRVGWYGEDPEAQRAWRIAWYSREGFEELKNTSSKVLLPLMYKMLTNECR